MRPVLLELDGFASYRTPTTVDFRDADFFVLVGPTGAGKSTVIDAMIFALYGTVPRWDDRSAVAPALAPTANRGVVRLIFDVGGKRYSVIRDVRRTAGNARATVREARLEMFISPEALGKPHDETTTLESGSPRVTKAVESLLGLDFGQFTQAVALPQGDFARFLHATDSDRQAILKSLLGYSVYDSVHRLANARAADNRTRAQTLSEQLETYADATEENIATLDRSLHELRDFEQHVTTVAIPALTTAAQQVATAKAQVAQLNSEREALRAVVVPAAIDELDSAHQAAKQLLAAAEAEQAQVEERDRKASAALQAAPPRHTLEQTLANWLEFEAVAAEIPALEGTAQRADAALKAAETERNTTAAALESARSAATEAERAAEELQTQVTATQAALDSLRAVSMPDGVVTISEAVRETGSLLAQARTDLEAAEATQQEATEALNAAPDPSVLASAASDAKDIASVVADELAGSSRRSELAETLAAAQQTAAQAAAQVAVAEKALRDAEVADRAAALRSEIKVGDDCPVCEQPITQLPAETVCGDIDEARSTLRQAKTTADEAAAAASRLDNQQHSAAAVRTQQLRRCDELRVRLLADLAALDITEPRTNLEHSIDAQTADDALSAMSDAASSALANITAAQARRTALEDTRKTSDAKVDTARTRVKTAENAAAQAEGNAATARAALRAARDGVSALNPPALDDNDIQGGWQQLTQWASATGQAVATQLAALTESAAEATAHAQLKGQERERADKAANEASGTFTAAALAKRSAEERLQARQQRHTQLTDALAGAAPVEVVEAQRKQVIALEDERSAAGAALDKARQAVSEARDALKQADTAIQTSWDQLRRARDPLTRFGAPEISGTDIAAGWRLLTDWSAAEASSRQIQIEAGERAAAEAQSRTTLAETSLIEALAARGIQEPERQDVPTLCTATTKLVATAVASANLALQRAQDQQRRAEDLRNQIKTANEDAAVAGELANLMRSNQFPRWLISTALDALLQDASAILMELSSGQFSLSRDDRDLLVIDHNDADMARLVKTLSGGETFQASLAMALALSEQITALSAQGASKLESIFLDEGFGTLDENTLDVVAGTLENLASSGSRIVGVITHVAALAERIPVRFEVTRDGSGSHVERQGL